MQVDEVLAQAREAMTVKRVFGDPIERDGMTVIPVANVMGGGGGGSGEGPMSVGAATGDGEATETSPGQTRPAMGSGAGAGFGVRATPAGVYVIKDGDVSWRPALDQTRIAVMGQLIGVFFLFIVWRLLRSWMRR